MKSQMLKSLVPGIEHPLLLTSDQIQTVCLPQYVYCFGHKKLSDAPTLLLQKKKVTVVLTWWQCGLDSLPYEYELLSVLPARG